MNFGLSSVNILRHEACLWVSPVTTRISSFLKSPLTVIAEGIIAVSNRIGKSLTLRKLQNLKQEYLKKPDIKTANAFLQFLENNFNHFTYDGDRIVFLYCEPPEDIEGVLIDKCNVRLFEDFYGHIIFKCVKSIKQINEFISQASSTKLSCLILCGHGNQDGICLKEEELTSKNISQLKIADHLLDNAIIALNCCETGKYWDNIAKKISSITKHAQRVFAPIELVAFLNLYKGSSKFPLNFCAFGRNIPMRIYLNRGETVSIEFSTSDHFKSELYQLTKDLNTSEQKSIDRFVNKILYEYFTYSNFFEYNQGYLYRFTLSAIEFFQCLYRTEFLKSQYLMYSLALGYIRMCSKKVGQYSTIDQEMVEKLIDVLKNIKRNENESLFNDLKSALLHDMNKSSLPEALKKFLVS